MVLRSDQWLEPEDHTVTTNVSGFAPLLSQYRAPSRRGVVVRNLWPSLEVAVTWPLNGGSDFDGVHLLARLAVPTNAQFTGRSS